MPDRQTAAPPYQRRLAVGYPGADRL